MLLIPAHAKVNLCLAVRGRRPDGFHDIDSVVMAIDWHDLVGVRLRPADETGIELSVSGAAAGVPVDGHNLAALAGHAVAAAAGPLGITVWLDKRIPGAAGLGGGSADAAAVLRACASLLGDGAPGHHELLGLAASLGSDVPVMMSRGTQRVRGRGELLTPVLAPPTHLAVAVAGSSGTAESYAALQPLDYEGTARSERVAAALESGRAPADELLGSGLEDAACRANPRLREALATLRAAVPEARWHMTGSGGAAFAIAGSAAHAAALAALAERAGFPARPCRSVSG